MNANHNRPTTTENGRVLALGAFLGALAVSAGAFGAHALRGRVSPADIEIWRTAAHYHILHATLITVLGLIQQRAQRLTWATGFLAVGTAIFCGTLYAMVLGGPRWLGAITPIGGMSLILAWTLLGWEGLVRAARNRTSS